MRSPYQSKQYYSPRYHHPQQIPPHNILPLQPRTQFMMQLLANCERVQSIDKKTHLLHHQVFKPQHKPQQPIDTHHQSPLQRLSKKKRDSAERKKFVNSKKQNNTADSSYRYPSTLEKLRNDKLSPRINNIYRCPEEVENQATSLKQDINKQIEKVQEQQHIINHLYHQAEKRLAQFKRKQLNEIIKYKRFLQGQASNSNRILTDQCSFLSDNEKINTLTQITNNILQYPSPTIVYNEFIFGGYLSNNGVNFSFK